MSQPIQRTNDFAIKLANVNGSGTAASPTPLPKSKFRDDVTFIGMPLTEICNESYTDARQRQLFKNILCLGALSALLEGDPNEIAQVIGEPEKGKEARL